MFEVGSLISPFLEVHGPELIDVDFGKRGVDQVFEVGDRGFAGGGEGGEDILFRGCYIGTNLCGIGLGVGGFLAHRATIRGVYSVDKVNGEVVLVRLPRDDGMAVLLERGNYSLDAAENGRVRSDLKVTIIRQWPVSLVWFSHVYRNW